MGFLDRVLRGAEFRSSGLATPQGWLLDALAGPRTYSGKRVSARGSMGLVAVYGAVALVSNAVGQIPLKVYREDPTGGGEKEEQREHRAWMMLHDAPNPVTPARRFWQTVTAQLLLYGNVFLEKRRPSMLVEELWLLDPTTITIEWDGVRKRYRQDLPAGGRKVWSDEEVLHMTGLSLDGLIGLSPIAECRHAVGTAVARDEFEGSFYKRGTVMSGIIEHPKKLGGEPLRNLRESMGALYGGSEKAHQTGVLEEGATFRPLSMTLADMQFVESKQLSRSDVAVIYNIPPGRLAAPSGDSLTYSTVEGNQLQLVQDAVKPWTSHIEESLSTDRAIFPQSSYFAEFLLEALLRGDADARTAYYTAMFNLRDDQGKRALDIDEIRARENLPPAKKPPTPPVPPPAPDAAAAGNGQPANGLDPAMIENANRLKALAKG